MLRIIKHQADNHHGNWDKVETLLDNFDDDIDALDDDGSSIIGYASHAGQWEIVDKILKSFHVKVDSRDQDGNTVFMNAVRYCNTNLVKKLLKRNVNVNAVNKFGNTVLHLAAWNGHSEIIDMLIEQKEINFQARNFANDTAMDIAQKYS